MVEDQSQNPLSTLNRSQFRDSFRACLSVVLKHQNVSISLLPPSKLQPSFHLQSLPSVPPTTPSWPKEP